VGQRRSSAKTSVENPRSYMIHDLKHKVMVSGVKAEIKSTIRA